MGYKIHCDLDLDRTGNSQKLHEMEFGQLYSIYLLALKKIQKVK